ncbi:MAG: hypothetical protein G01um101444_273 [Parcubacteria group bacterium Gr01-1014_44]|nr:MAG: hypothetical protein G01um101444_273 [Parcubacteria group bacterium Gr01-1014_44]
MRNLNELNGQVSVAILEAEQAQRKVSYLEEEISKLTPPFSAEGRIARRGAVRAAMAGRDEERAKELVSRFLAEEGRDEKLSEELVVLIR